MCNLRRQLPKCQRRISPITEEIAIMETTTIQIIDEIVVYPEADIIMSKDHAQDQDNFVLTGQVISSDINRLLETIIKGANLIIGAIIVDIARIEVSHLEPHSCRIDTILYEEVMRIELPQQVVIESRCQGAQRLFMSTSRA